MSQPSKPDKFTRAALKVAKIVSAKNRVYGDSFTRADEFFKLLYPKGVRPDQYKDMLVLAREFDKMMRIATGADGEESPYIDLCGYSLLMVAKEEESDDDEEIPEKAVEFDEDED